MRTADGGRRTADGVIVRALSLLLGFLVAAPAAWAQTGADTSAVRRPPSAVVSILTFGPGTAIWERFGHNALRIQDPARGLDLAYNWGMFDFQQSGFLRRFLTGETRYWMAPYPGWAMIESYRQAGRSVVEQELELTAAQVAELEASLARDSTGESKYYRYDYFLDNCSTRLRDAIDRVLNGTLQGALGAVQTGRTYRGETRRLLSADPAARYGIGVALGHRADEPLSGWEASFVPTTLRDLARDVRVRGANGAPVPFVRAERLVAPGFPEPAPRGENMLASLLVGLILAAAIVLLTRAGRRSAGARRAVALVAVLFGVVTGIVGVVLVLAWVATRHEFWGLNSNLLVLSPLGLLLPFAWRGFTGGESLRARFAGRELTLAMAGLAVLGVLLQLIPLTRQDSDAVFALAVPVHLALAWAAFELSARTVHRRSTISGGMRAVAD